MRRRYPRKGERMTAYTLSYYIRDAESHEEGVTVTDALRSWQHVRKVFEASSTEDAIEFVKTYKFPIGSIRWQMELWETPEPYRPPKKIGETT
jgi:hypothetical protein